MNKFKTIVFLCLTTAIFFSSCKPTLVKVDPGIEKQYFPLQKGHTITYQVDSTIWDDFGAGNTYSKRYYIKDVVDSSFTDLQNNLSHVVLRYISQDSLQNFNLKYAYYVTPTSKKIEVVEENLRYIKLIFPLTINDEWFGNNYIGGSTTNDLGWLDGWKYKYVKFGDTYIYNTYNCDSVLNIRHTDTYTGDSLAFSGRRTYSIEKYGKSQGLVYKQLINWKQDPALGGGKRKGFAVTLNTIKVEN